jgi:uncharacterized protein YeaO (DUF488 family)
MIRIKRVYLPPQPEEEGARFLVDRLWPRGISKARLGPVTWLREVAPSRELRDWYGHDAERWEEFCQRYFNELERSPTAWQPLMDAAARGDITLLFAAKDGERCNAAALKRFLELKR